MVHYIETALYKNNIHIPLCDPNCFCTINVDEREMDKSETHHERIRNAIRQYEKKRKEREEATDGDGFEVLDRETGN